MIISCLECDGDVKVGLYWTDDGTPYNRRWLEVDTIERQSCECEETEEWKKVITERALEAAAEGDD